MKTKNVRKNAANVMQLWRGVDARKMAKVYVPVFSAAEMAKARKGGLFKLGKKGKGWSSLEEAKAACIREVQILSQRHARKFHYPPYSVKWTSRLSEKFSAIHGYTIWDLRGDQPKPIRGWVACYRPAKKSEA